MAHVLLAVTRDEVYTHLFTAALEADGHTVTAATDLWGVLAVLRTSLHPLVCLYFRHPWMPCLLLADEEHEEQVAAPEAARADLARHRYVGIGWKPGALRVPRLAAIEDGLQVEIVPAMPVNLEAVADAVLRAAEQLPA